MENKNRYPCTNCAYFQVCGDITRTEECKGRKECNATYIGHYPNGTSIAIVPLMEKCPICNAELEQETYYDEENEDTSYYNYCPNCDWDDYPAEYLNGETENENSDEPQCISHEALIELNLLEGKYDYDYEDCTYGK